MMTLNDVKLSFNFNLRRPCDARRATPIYCVVRLDHRQMKFPTALKVYPHHWDSRKQECVVSADMGEAERNDNMQANRVIFALRCKIDEIISYLCSGGVIVDADYMERYIKSKLKISKDMANRNPEIHPRTKTATKLLDEAFESMYPEKGNNVKGTTRGKQEERLEVFKKYLAETKQGDSVNRLTQDGLNDYREYLVKKKSLSSNYINNCCQLIARLVNKVLRVESKYRSLQLARIEYTTILDPRNHEEMKHRELTKEEIASVMNCTTLDEKEQQYRDVFTMQLSTGVRFSDLGKIFTRKYSNTEYEGRKSYTIKTEKYGVTAVIIVNETIVNLQDKYENGFLFGKLTQSNYNDALKRIFKKAGLTYMEHYFEDVAGQKFEVEEPLCEAISNHYLRHTFITQRLREGWTPDKLVYLTGHSSLEMVTRIYNHLKENDKAFAAIQEYNRVNGLTPQANPVDVEAVARLAVEKQKATEQLNAERQRNASLEQMLTIEEQRREIEQRKHQHEVTAWATGTTLEEYRQTMAELDEQADEAEIDI